MITDDMQKVRSLGKPAVDGTWLDGFAIDVEDKPQTYERLLRALPPGLSEWAVHPALATEDWKAIEPAGWRVRQSDHGVPHIQPRPRGPRPGPPDPGSVVGYLPNSAQRKPGLLRRVARAGLSAWSSPLHLLGSGSVCDWRGVEQGQLGSIGLLEHA
jgi:hypothetical protein